MGIERKLDPRIVVKVKPDDEIVNNSNVLQDDDDLQLEVLTDEFWYIKLITYFTSPAAADIKFQWSAPALAFVGSHLIYTTAYFDASTPVTRDGADATVVLNTWDTFYAGGSNGGTLKLQWAQAAAVASDTKLKKGSSMICVRLI